METDTLAIIGSWLTIMIALLWQSYRHEDSIKALDTTFTDKLEKLDTTFTDKLEKLDTKFTERLDASDTKFTERLDASDTKLTALDAKVTALDAKVTVLGESSKEQGRLLGEARERLSRVEEHMEDHGRRLGELHESSNERSRVLVQVRERLARVEGYLMPPGGFSLPRRSQPGEDDTPADDPRTEHHQEREAG